ncbi:hypothetical protein DFH11DRAFT_366697 [Phellopilus nigrolimitatus]|nr:hypothetical protein DFH11DRAFT_366697 [Phellopilus nigrolimitatus]
MCPVLLSFSFVRRLPFPPLCPIPLSVSLLLSVYAFMYMLKFYLIRTLCVPFRLCNALPSSSFHSVVLSPSFVSSLCATHFRSSTCLFILMLCISFELLILIAPRAIKYHMYMHLRATAMADCYAMIQF